MAEDEKKETLSEVIRIFPSDLKRLVAFREGFEEPGRTFARALDRAKDAEAMAVFIEVVQEQIDQEHGIDEELWTELRGDLLTRGAPRER